MWNFQHLAQGAISRIPFMLLGVANSAKVAPPPPAAFVSPQSAPRSASRSIPRCVIKTQNSLQDASVSENQVVLSL
jgi:hypothetical protein